MNYSVYYNLIGKTCDIESQLGIAAEITIEKNVRQ